MNDMREQVKDKDGSMTRSKLGLMMGSHKPLMMIIGLVLLVATISYGMTMVMRAQLPKEGFVMVLEGQPSRESFKVLKSKFSKNLKYAITYDYLYDRERLRMVNGALGWQQAMVLLEGRLDFSQPEYVVLSEAKALSTFGRTNCTGQSVIILGKMRQVVGVVKGSSAESGALAPLMALGKVLRNVGGLPSQFVLGNIGSGKGIEAAGIDASASGVQAQAMGSDAMMPAESQIDVWLGYDDELLSQRPWVTSLWGRFDDGSEQMQRLANTLGLKSVKVRSMSANRTKTEVFWHGGQFILAVAAIYLCLKGLAVLIQAIVKEYNIYALSRYTYQFKWRKNDSGE